RVCEGDSPDEKLIEFVAKAFEKGGVKRKPKKKKGKAAKPEDSDAASDESGDDDADEAENATNILLFVSTSAIESMAAATRKAWSEKKRDVDALAGEFADILGRFAAVPDIALSGRMTELDRKGLFAEIDLSVEAALASAHAISTHAVVNEVDYFTAVDDLTKGTGAGHVAEAMFNSACFYKYFCLDWDQLVSNLTPRDADDAAKKDARRLAAATLGHFLRAAACTTPSGKKNSFAPFNPPDGVLIEVKPAKTAVNYANAFADPVPERAPRGLVGESVARLGQYVADVTEGFGVKSDRFWFSPNGRYPLTWIDRDPKAKETEKEKPVVPAADRNLGSLDALVSATVKAASGLDWSEVADAGKAAATGT
ncbi:MAG: type I-E CRISPR-associated protein Cas7/Cse4/CasC, partial [Candidatus Methylomirabilis sp.]|nr:type I-E CRISPR-associated protein Cas7/Cse4/CasC [Deltaproteobacteria bacterium]